MQEKAEKKNMYTLLSWESSRCSIRYFIVRMRASPKQLGVVLTGAARSCCTTRHPTYRKTCCRHFYGCGCGSAVVCLPCLYTEKSILRLLYVGICRFVYCIGDRCDLGAVRGILYSLCRFTRTGLCCFFFFLPPLHLEINPGATVQ